MVREGFLAEEGVDLALGGRRSPLPMKVGLTGEENPGNPEVAGRKTEEANIRGWDPSQAEVKIICRGGGKPMIAIMTCLEEYQ